MLNSAADVKRAVVAALGEANLFVRAVVTGYAKHNGVTVIFVNVLFSRFEQNDAAFVDRVRGVVVGLGVGSGRLVALFPTQKVDNPETAG
jgi:hypothetical protein